jgi:tRNA G18 (ribose-2'-O)-methylase SpoU
MVTDRYQHVRHHDGIDALAAWARERDLPVIGIDNLPGSQLLSTAELPMACLLLFGQEGPGLSDTAREICTAVLHIPQFGSTRSINAGVASGIAMYEWVRRHARSD